MYLNLIKVNNYPKNLLVFLPWIFEHTLSRDLFFQLFHIFIVLCLVTSINYIVNDIVDINKDKNHKIKKKRPLPSGIISISKAIFVIFIILVLLIITVLFYDFDKIELLKWVGIYLILANIYTFFLKKIVFLDLFFLPIFYVFRTLIGGYLTNIEVSSWLISIAFLFFLYLATYKKLIDVNQTLNLKSEKYYKFRLILNGMMGILIYIISIIIILYSISSKAEINANPHFFILLAPMLLFFHHILIKKNKNENHEFINIFFKNINFLIILFLSILIISFGY